MEGAAHGHWGEVLAVAAQHPGIAGLIIDGGVRDSDEMAAMDFPVFSRSVTVVGTVKDDPGDLRSPVRIGGIVVHTGDLIVGDAGGIIVLPQYAVAETISRADQRVADERRILDELRNGKTTLELYGLSAEGTHTTH